MANIINHHDVPLVSATAFNVPPQAVDDGAGVYGTKVAAAAGLWVLGSDIPDGSKFMVMVQTGALTGAPTALKVSLWGGGTDHDGLGSAEIAATVTEWATPAGGTTYWAEIDTAYITDLTKYYSLALTSNGGGATSILAGASAFIAGQAQIS
jgi:hypothetical protein